jgi:ubiquinone/menaquinone biosynthesis C-methylase UbiE
MVTKGSKTQKFYDKIADAHNVALQLNGYRGSVARYLKSIEPGIGPESWVLDAGSGTGIVTMGFYSAGFDPKRTVTFDLSRNSLSLGRQQFRKDRRTPSTKISPVQGNVLALPFADDSFDLVLSCGVLEYVPLDEGLRELARVMKPGGKLVFIPVKPSIVGVVLEFLYKFKVHPMGNVRESAQRYFRIVGNHKFKITEAMGWSKVVFLLEKK